MIINRTRLKLDKIGLVVKHQHPEAFLVTLDLSQFIISKGYELFFAEESRPLYNELHKKVSRQNSSTQKSKTTLPIKIIKKSELLTKCDLIVVIGGDGTFLSIARLINSHSVPIMGINLGQLGFLTEVKKHEAIEAMRKIFESKSAIIQTRSLAEMTLKRKNKIIYSSPVVNDVVISKGAIARIIDINILIDDKDVTTVKGDGVIISTPTGSTAYSLAAGGPFVEPSLPALVITPICAHSITHRPIVISDESTIKLRLARRPGQVLLTLDGQEAISLKENDIIEIKKYKKHKLQLITIATRDYFSLLREKLSFGLRY